MTIIEFKNKFFNFEKKYNLFDLKMQNGIYWWDIVRYNVYTELLLIMIWKQELFVPNKMSKFKKFILFLKLFFKDVFYLIRKAIGKSDFLFFINTRNRDSNGFSCYQLLIYQL